MNRDALKDGTPPLVDFLLHPEKYPAAEEKPEPKRRGRPRRFDSCPECGAEGLFQTNQRKAGHCVNIYCECPACGAKVRYVAAGNDGHWVRVRAL